MSPALPGELVADVTEGEEWLTSHVIDQLYLQMCEGPQVNDPHDEGCKYSDRKINFHYLEAVNYARRRSYGNFEGKNSKYKPMFTIDAIGFTPRLKAELRIANDAKALQHIVTESVFKIFKSCHKLIFYEHIEPHKLSWNIINL